LIGDTSSAADRANDPGGWAFTATERATLAAIIAARRDVRHFRPDDLDEDIVECLLQAAHRAPSVGHSQPWRFIVVRDQDLRTRAGWMADRQRLRQAAAMDEPSARQLLQLQLEGIREAPVGVVVCCDRRVVPAGVLGRATYPDTDLWSCACAIQNLWLAARAAGLGVGWVTLFEPSELAELLGIPGGVETLGWLCIGYPDERLTDPGLERHGWSARQPLADLVMSERWNEALAPPPPRSRVAAPEPSDLVTTRDDADRMLTPPGSLGILDQALDRIIACCGANVERATLVLSGGDHPVADLGVTPYARSVTPTVLSAAAAGQSIGISAAIAAGLDWRVVDAGSSTGDLVSNDAMTPTRTLQLIADGTERGAQLARDGLVVLGEVGIGNTTVAAALASAMLGLPATEVVGRGSGADSAMIKTKCSVVDAAVARWRRHHRGACDGVDLLSALGGPEFALMCGLALGASRSGGVVILDGYATSVAAAVACAMEPAVSAHLVAGQRSNEAAHGVVLRHLGLEPLLDLRLRAGEGVGGVMATRMLLDGLKVRRTTARTTQFPGPSSQPSVSASHDAGEPDRRWQS
jgi:nicotinate-nucleotide--dimethylbenzimidazole phosphoribosyltransferase